MTNNNKDSRQPITRATQAAHLDDLRDTKEAIAAVSPADLSRTALTGEKVDTGRRDAQGNMVIYYSFNSDGVPDELAATFEPSYTGSKGREISFDGMEPVERSTFRTAARNFEAFLPVRFEPAPAGMTPDIIVGHYNKSPENGSIENAVQIDSVPRIIALNRVSPNLSNSFNMEAILRHEIGHYFGLKHPNGDHSSDRGGINMGMTRMTSTRASSGFSSQVADTWVTLSPAEVSALQAAYGMPNVAGTGRATMITPISQMGDLYVEDRASINAGITISPREGNIALDITEYYAELGVPEGSFAAILQADKGGELHRPGGMRDVLFLPPGAPNALAGVNSNQPLEIIRASQYADSLTASYRLPSILMGEGGEDHYIIPAIDEQIEHRTHRIIDSGTNSVYVAEGASLQIEYMGDGPSKTELSVDFPIRNVVVSHRNETETSLMVFSDSSDAITMITLPSSDQQIEQGRMAIRTAGVEHEVDISEPLSSEPMGEPIVVSYRAIQERENSR